VTVDPDACFWCDVPQREHCQRWRSAVGWHGWVEPLDALRLLRMRARRALRLALVPTVSPQSVGEVGVDQPREGSAPTHADFEHDLERRMDLAAEAAHDHYSERSER
jgi:hypothetical protein